MLHSTQDRSYGHALELLNSISSNQAVTQMVGKSAADMNALAIPEMLEWLQKADYTVEDLKRLKVVHVAGTKGKGSVCAMVAGILKQYAGGLHGEEGHEFSNTGAMTAKLNTELSDQEFSDNDVANVSMDPRPVKMFQDVAKGLGDIGLYTSPHLVTVRERIRINGEPISQDDFAASFFRLWDRFSARAAAERHPDPSSPQTKPGFFRYLTIMAFDLFLSKGITSAVFECGIGGEYDSTNVLPAEAVSVAAITKLGIDHTAMLGNTLQSIAWHKSGIFKPGVAAFTAPQSPEASTVLQSRAKELGCSLETVTRKRESASRKLAVSLEGDFQLTNARLAVAVAAEHLYQMGYGRVIKDGQWPDAFDLGLASITWPGRCEVRHDGKVTWFIDGAHNDDSIRVAAQWFAKRVDITKPAMLIFNQQIRDGVPLLKQLHHDLRTTTRLSKVFKYGVFCSNTVFKTADRQDLTSQAAMVDAWSGLEPEGQSTILGSIEEAVEYARSIGAIEDVQVLVTGSLHLVGGTLQVLDGAGRDDMSVR